MEAMSRLKVWLRCNARVDVEIVPLGHISDLTENICAFSWHYCACDVWRA